MFRKVAPPTSPTTHTSAEACLHVCTAVIYNVDFSRAHVDSHAEVEKEINTQHT